MSWEIVQLDSKLKKEQVKKELNKLLDESVKVEPLQDLSWLLEEEEVNENIYVCLYKKNQELLAYSVLRKQFRPLKLYFGEFTIYSFSFYRYEMWAEILFKSQIENKELIVSAFVQFILENLKKNEVLSIEGLPLHSELRAALIQKRHLDLGQPFQHQSIVMPAMLEDYLKQMSTRSRKSVQYSQRKVKKDFTCVLQVLDSKEGIEDFLDKAIEISKQTYQWNLLGLGLRNREGLKKTLSNWESKGALRCYLLILDGSPVSFMLGYIYQTTYYYIDVGFDPAWSKYSVGSVLQMEVLEDLYKLPSPPEVFDFSTGYGEHKARFGNHQQNEINMILLPGTMLNSIRIIIYKSFSALSEQIVNTMDKLGIKKRLKKILRRAA